MMRESEAKLETVKPTRDGRDFIAGIIEVLSRLRYN